MSASATLIPAAVRIHSRSLLPAPVIYACFVRPPSDRVDRFRLLASLVCHFERSGRPGPPAFCLGLAIEFHGFDSTSGDHGVPEHPAAGRDRFACRASAFLRVLYTPLSGVYGVLSGLLVGIKQILSDQELNLFVFKISAKWIPSIVAFVSVAVSLFLKESMAYLPIILFGIYVSWIYLRYFQRRLEVGLKGDPSDEFSFSSFFPGFLRPVLDPIGSIFHKLFCGRSARSEGTGQTLDGSQIPGSGTIEANRRRERGQRALEQRLAEKLAAVRNVEGTAPPLPQQQQLEDDASDKV
ncbi:hypothetical protein HU200_018006 [Digitaria exilis]|uniref:Transmembrane protein 115 n=1 Tax=Digitaria exilis TaxID=1010633 RepID=A0A835KEW8_9POAL|nr:hypothetical protein HU200_018006 [Digitaria exilis]